MKPVFLLASLLLLVIPIPALTSNSQTYRVPDAQLSSLASLPLAAFMYTPCVACASIGQPVFFDASWSTSTNGPIVSYSWNFGDGTATTKTNSSSISHVYLSSASAWLVSLSVQDSTGQNDNVSQRVMFSVQPEFVFEPTKPVASQPITFNASSTQVYQSPDSLQGFNWNFGDGSTGTGKLVVHSFATGVYRIFLLVLTAQGDAQGSKTIAVGKPTPGLNVIIKSIFGIAFYNSTGKITIQPASLFLNMSVTQSNSTGVVFKINSGRITIGPSPIVMPQRNFTSTSGQAFQSNTGRLTITAVMIEVYSCQENQPPCMIPSPVFQLYLTGPSRLALTNSTWTFFTRLFGFLYNSQSKIGLFFVAGVSPGDIDEIGTVDIRDLSTAASCFGTDNVEYSMTVPTSSPTGYSNAFYSDVNGDGQVDIRDLSLVATNFGQTY